MLKQEILNYLQQLNELLEQQQSKGEICLYGGAVMCLVYEARPSTKDVDAVFHPAQLIRELAVQIANEHDLPRDWLNDGVKGFVVDHPRKIFLSLPCLTVMVAEAEYLLAMKLLAARADTTDRQDIVILLRELKINSSARALAIIDKYYPRRIIRPATRFFLEELFDERENR